MKVICVFERDLEDSEKGELLQIFSEPKDALYFIGNHEGENLFWEQWEVTSPNSKSVVGKI